TTSLNRGHDLSSAYFRQTLSCSQNRAWVCQIARIYGNRNIKRVCEGLMKPESFMASFRGVYRPLPPPPSYKSILLAQPLKLPRACDGMGDRVLPLGDDRCGKICGPDG